MKAVAWIWAGSVAMATGASAGVTTQTFTLNMYGGELFGGSLSTYAQSTYGSATGWLARSTDYTYKAYTGATKDLSEVALVVRIHVDGVTTARTFGTKLTIGTGVTPNTATQHNSLLTSITTDNKGDWTYTWRYTGADLAAWNNPPYGPDGTVFGELFGRNSWSTGTITAALSFTTVPAPACLSALAVFGVGARRGRRAA